MAGVNHCTSSMPATISSTPAIRPILAGFSVSPIKPKWSISSDDSICPAITQTIKLAAPRRGVNIKAAVM
ncbi:hypothetical protein D3C81_1841180 [compost metagenome]